MKKLMELKPGVIEDIIRNAENFQLKKNIKTPTQLVCVKCGKVSSNKICKACKLIKDLDNLEFKGKKQLVMEN